MSTELVENRIGELFEFSVILKGIHAVIEMAGGLLLFLLPLGVFSRFALWLTRSELLDDPHDLVANYILNLGNQLSLGGNVFGGLYLLSHGVIKIVLVIALLKNKLWAYPWSLGVLGMFIVYQVYRCTLSFSIGMVLLSIFDLAVMWLIWTEYRIVKTHRHKTASDTTTS